MNKIGYLAFFLALISLFFQWRTNQELDEMYCDLSESIFVERRFDKEMLKKQDVYIDNQEKFFYPNGKEVMNPITTNSKYDCN